MESQGISSKNEFLFGYCEELNLAKRSLKIKNKIEQLNSWCLERTVLLQALDCDQADDKEKAIDFQCLFCC